jgi:hypothetical protein
MKRFERISYMQGCLTRGRSYEDYMLFLKSRISDFGKGFYDQRYQNTCKNFAITDIDFCTQVVCMKHAEIPMDIELDNIEFFVRKGVEIAIETFWTKSPSGKYLRNTIGLVDHDWVYIYPSALFCALILSNDESLNRLTGWIVDESLLEEPVVDITEIDMFFIVVLSKYICSQSLDEHPHLIESIRLSKRRRPKILLNVLESINHKDQYSFANSTEKYIKHFIKNEVDLSDGNWGSLSLYASCLWEVARRAGIQLPILPEEIMDRIVTRESVGLITPQK